MKTLFRLPSRRYGTVVLVLMLAPMILGACITPVARAAPANPHLASQSLMPVSLRKPEARHATRPESVIEPGLDLYAGPVDVPLEIRIPSLKVHASVLGVGLTAQNVMDAPHGEATDPVWQKVFWYRGGSIPGHAGTATLAGHVDDIRGRPAIFARLGSLQPGDPIYIHDTRTGLDMRFTVVELALYSAQEAVDPATLARIYGPGTASGRGPEPGEDNLAHLTLITCSGRVVNGAYDHRLVVYATRNDAE